LEQHIPLSWLLTGLAVSLAVSGFFSAAETSLMSLNRYRLRHLASKKHLGAVHASKLLQRPDRLIGLILVGNNFANSAASALATLIGIRFLSHWVGEEYGIAIAASVVTILTLIFSEIAPKTLAAIKPEPIAFPTAVILTPLLKIFYPLVWCVSAAANGLLRLVGASPEAVGPQNLSREELRTVVNEAGALIPRRHQKMLLSILDLEKVAVEDIMVPRNEVVGINLDDAWDDIVAQLINSQYTRVLVYKTSIDDVKGFVHVRKIVNALSQGKFTREDLMKVLREAYFVPEGTPLNTQLLNFQRERRRVGIVVDEYGDIKGLVTLEDILEEIVGEFTTDPTDNVKDIHPQEDGSYLIDGSINVRELNRALRIKLPTKGPKTLNGLITEFLETIPQSGTALLLEGHPVEIVQTKGTAVKMVRMRPRRKSASDVKAGGTD
jgi:Mg2+/Co2+ transporter CorB